MPQSPNELVQDTILEASKLGCRLFRNNVGLGWVGKVINITKEVKLNLRPGDKIIRAARPLHAGLCKGSSDGIGLTPIVITQEMVGKTIAVFTAIEGKTGSAVADEDQKSFINMVISFGGIAGIVHNIKDVRDLLSQFKISNIIPFEIQR